MMTIAEQVAALAVCSPYDAAAELRELGQKLADEGGLPLLRATAWDAFGEVADGQQVHFGHALNMAWMGVAGWPGRRAAATEIPPGTPPQ